MLAEPLTPDNPHYHGPLIRLDATIAERCAVNCTNDLYLPDADCQAAAGAQCSAEAVRALIEYSLSDSTRVAYQSDLKHFRDWGGTIPASPATIAAYIAAFADTLAVATISRRISTLSKAHEVLDANPCRSALVRATLQGLRRRRGTAQQQAKPLLRDDLMLILDRLGTSTRDSRDRALLLVGFSGGFRRSELVGLDRADIEHVRQGLVITLRRSKTDQEGAGRKIGIPFGRTRNCPVAALDMWLSHSGIDAGPVFRPVDRHGYVHTDRLSGDAVSGIIRERVAYADMDATGFSGHSLRAGFATSAAQAGVSTLKIRAQTGHTSDAMLARYIRDGELFTGNAAGALL